MVMTHRPHEKVVRDWVLYVPKKILKGAGKVLGVGADTSKGVIGYMRNNWSGTMLAAGGLTAATAGAMYLGVRRNRKSNEVIPEARDIEADLAYNDAGLSQLQMQQQMQQPVIVQQPQVTIPPTLSPAEVAYYAQMPKPGSQVSAMQNMGVVNVAGIPQQISMN